MATETRREARRRKLLQNPEDRLRKIIGSRLSHPTSSHSQLETDENVLSSFNPVKSDNVDGEMELADTDPGQENELMAREKEGLLHKRGLQLKDQTTEMGSTEGYFKSKDPETERDVVNERTRSLDTSTHTSDVHDNTRSASLPQSSVLSSPSVNQTVERGRSSSESNRRRVLFNVVLAFVLVSKWTYVNLEVLLATRTGDGEAPDNSHKLLVHSESMVWPFLALQLFFVCVTNLPQTSQSPFISMLTVALQLCGIPIQFTHKINFVLTSLLSALKDFVVFLFSVILFHHAVRYSIRSGLLIQVLEHFE